MPTEAKYGVGIYGDSVYGGVEQPPLNPGGGATPYYETSITTAEAVKDQSDYELGNYGGVVKVWGECYDATAGNAVGDVIAGLSKGSVTMDVEQPTPSRFNAELNYERESFVPYKTFVAPFLNVEYIDPNDPTITISKRSQMGLYVMTPPKKSYYGVGMTHNIECFDMTWLVAQTYFQSAYTVPKLGKATTYVKSILNSSGFVRYLIPDSTRLIPKEMSWRPGTSKLAIINDLLAAIGFYQLWADWTGRLVSSPFRSLGGREEYRLFDGAKGDIGTTVEMEPDRDRIKNDVIVIGNDPGTAPITARATNKDRDSPTSIWALANEINGVEYPRYLTKVHEDPNLESYAAALETANRLLEEASSVYTRLSISIVPDPYIPIREPIKLQIEHEDGRIIANGKWWWSELSFGFTPEDAEMKLTCNKLLGFERAT